MFENVFNLSFNLHKSYTSIGIDDYDVKKIAAMYEMSEAEAVSNMEQFDRVNYEAAREIIKECGEPPFGRERKARIAFLGDSITSYRMSYRGILQQLFKEYNGIEFGDFSISGYKVTDLFTMYYPYIHDFGADYATIMIGTNDMRITDDGTDSVHTPISHFERDVDYLLKKFADDGCRVILITLPPFDMNKMSVALDGWHIMYREELKAEYDAVLEKCAKQNNAILLDMRKIYPQYDYADITIEDGLHLNPEGHKILTKQLYPQLMQLMK